MKKIASNIKHQASGIKQETRRTSFLILCTLYSVFSFGQAGQWVWLHGSNAVNDTGNHGVLGVPSPTNDPTSVYETCEWTDKNGKFWIYGGYDFSFHNDLWKYDPLTNEWTWMAGTNTLNDPGVFGVQGIPSPTNRPPGKSYGVTSWADTTGNLWLFGGLTVGGNSCDLWRYDISANEWTWMKGPNTTGQLGVYGTQGVPDTANFPGYRWECATAWTDGSNNLWLFGGFGGSYNDLWRYNVSTNTWTWMKGSNLTNQTGVYGTWGVEDSLNTPGARGAYSHWKDNNGNFWMFGGIGNFNDLWKYNLATNNWTWFGGSNTTSIYGTKCVADSANIPGGRYENRAVWVDQNGNFWMFGGFFYWNDLWMYCVSTNKWIWENGDTITSPSGNWGTQGVWSPTNKPDGRGGAVGWTDHQNHLYLFGGSTDPFCSPHNDMWEFDIDTSCGACSGSPVANFNCSDTAFCTESGKCIHFFDHSTGNPTSWHWIFQGAIPDSSNLQNPDSICYYAPGTYPVTLIVANSGGSDTLAVTPLIIFGTAPPPPTIVVNGGDTLVSSHCSHYQWYRNGLIITGATDSTYIATQGGTYSVQGTDSLGCSALSSGVFISGLANLSNGDGVELYPNPVSNELIISFASKDKSEAVITDMLGHELIREIIYQSKNTHTISVKDLSNGIYLLQFKMGAQTVNKKFIVVHQ